MRRVLAVIASAVCFASLPACSGSGDESADPPAGDGTPALLEDVAPESSIEGEHGIGDASTYPFTGQAWADTDGDGLTDVYLTAGQGPNVLWKNLGGERFELSAWAEDITLPLSRSGRAVFADADTDGWTDLTVSSAEGLTLHRNLEGQGFADVTDAAGLTGAGAAPAAAAWGDGDGDGFADLYVVHGGCAGCLADGRDRLYRNNGDGTFAEATAAISRSSTDGAGTDAAWTDADGDGDADVVVAGDSELGGAAMTVLRNDSERCGSLCLVEVRDPAAEAVSGQSARAVAVTAAPTGPGQQARTTIFLATSEGVLAFAPGAGGLEDVTEELGLGDPVDAAAVTPADLDGDGAVDLYVTAASGDDLVLLGGRDEDGAGFSAEGTEGRIPAHSGAGPGAGAAAGVVEGRLWLAVGTINAPYRILRAPGSAG